MIMYWIASLERLKTMQPDLDLITRMHAITISREYGSGGGEIARRLAQRLQWQLVDHEIVVRVAQELGVSVEEAEAQDEYTESITSRILSSLQAMQPMLFAISPLPTTADTLSYQEALAHVVEGSVAAGHVVIVGRGAQMLLEQRRDVLHIRVIAPLEQRIAYVMRRESLKYEDARTRIQVKDQDRIRYLQNVHHRRPDDALLYDMTLNTGILALDQVVELICVALQEKATRLSIITGELGPGVGMERYAGRPGDFRPPATITDTSHK
jgi:CMP/dCMP kinase